MTTLKKLFVALATPFLTLVLLAWVVLLSFNLALGQPNHLKQWVKGSGVYEKAPEVLIEQAAKEESQSSISNELSLSRPEAQQAFRAAVTPKFLQASAESIIDGSYNWLQGETEKPNYTINLAPVKQVFADNLATSARSRLASLPACSWYNLPTTDDPFLIGCQPPADITETQIQEITQQITQGDGFLPQESITADTTSFNLDTTSTNQPESQQSAQDTPWYKNLSMLPNLYTWAMRAPWVLGLLGVFTATGIVLAASSKRKGLRIISAAMLSSGLLLAVCSVASIYLFKRVGETFNDTSSLQDSVIYIINSIGNHMGHTQLWWGIGLIAVGIAGLISLSATRPRTPKAVAPGQPKDSPSNPRPSSDQ